ncbi:acetyltransferase [Sphingobacterium multivorum]|uniref:acetyltransferase n=1 Tax=Sphingobacterium multivorum TaxID=28454 RepID=UPI000E9F610B|nr:acetyltransferase [Flavobacteriaceae bacterium]
MIKLGIFGAGGHAKVAIEIAELSNIEDIYLCADVVNHTSLFGYKIHDKVVARDKFFIAVGDNASRKKISQRIDNNFIKLFHPNSTISKRAVIGDGTVVMSGVSINSNAKIGQHCIINTNASIDHDCVIESFVHISPNVALTGNVFVGEGTHVGVGANVIPGVKIGKWCVIGAGAVIIRDVPDYSTIVGNPGREVKKDFNG